jgi:hypothetical protein
MVVRGYGGKYRTLQSLILIPTLNPFLLPKQHPQLLFMMLTIVKNTP